MFRRVNGVENSANIGISLIVHLSHHLAHAARSTIAHHQPVFTQRARDSVPFSEGSAHGGPSVTAAWDEKTLVHSPGHPHAVEGRAEKLLQTNAHVFGTVH